MMTDTQNIVYYSGFWYSSFSPIGISVYDLILNEKKLLDRLKTDIRLLTLIFDIIHVPRSHLLTFHTNHNWSVVNQYFADRDFSYLVEHQILRSSSLPYIDEYSDTERIIERVKNKKWSKNVDDSFITAVKNVTAIKIDSSRESKNNVDIFQQYISILKDKNRKVGYELDEIKKRANYKNVPFLHEMFVEELFKTTKIDNASKVEIWRITNTMYITTGCLDLGDDRRISVNKNIEEIDCTKNDNTGVLRELYSPEFIETLIIEELGESYLIKFKNANLYEVMIFRELESWKSFKTEIFQMFETLSQIEKIKPIEFAHYKGKDKLLAYKKYILGDDKDKFASLIAELMEVASGIYDPVLGKTVKTGKSIIADSLIKRYASWKLSKKLEHYRQFWKDLKKILNNID
jgi:hypothetical protein